jgi:Mg-chelatase subunit ChlD
MRWPSLALLLLLAAVPAAAQSSASSAETRAAQFVLVIDDSASMRQTDPNRLAVFAAQAFLAMLDDRDEVSLVRLNGAALGEEPPPIQSLSRGRKRLNELLAGGVAAYAGKETTCRSALASTRRLLDQAHRANVAQVVLFLTDGVCAPADREIPDPRAFLGGLRSHAEGLLQFYLLRFRGGDVSPQLPQLAAATGGDVIEVPAGDPTALLHGFAAALSRSQGYEAELVSPADPEIAAHRGARRVRLLAVAPGESPNLGVSVHDLQGRSPKAAGRPGVHRYPGGAPTVAGIQDHPGQPFRFVAMDYRPETSPMTVRVTGAGSDWKVVAMPEYRLFLKMTAREGSCENPGRPVADRGMETGASVCLEADLVNEAGITVDAGLTGRDLEAFVRMGRADQPSQAVSILPMVPVGAKARFRLQRNNLEKGDLVLQPVVRLNLSGGQQAELRGRSVPLQVSSVDVQASLDRPDFGRLRPGEEAVRKLRLQGVFPAAPLRLGLRDRKDIPACVTVELDGEPEGRPVKVAAGSEHTASLRVAPYCAPRTLQQTYSTRLVLSFEGLSPREIPISFALDHQLKPPGEVPLKVKGGRREEKALPLLGNRQKDLRLTATLTGTTPETWPEKLLELALGGTPVGEPFTLRRDGEPLRLRAAANPCCAAGSYLATLELRPASPEGYAPRAEPPEPLVIPVRIEVESAGVWACWGYWIVRGLLLLLLLLAILYLVNMFRNTRWLKPVRVAEKLVPLAWTAHGGTAPLKDHKARVLELVKGSLPWPRRIAAWLRANPLAFGLPGRAYRETLELILQPHRDVSRSAAVLVPRRGFQEAIGRDPAAFTGRLFAVAEGNVSFLCVPEKDGRIGRMSLDGAAPAQDPDPTRRSAVRLRGHKLLRHPEEWESHEEGRAAGWQVG